MANRKQQGEIDRVLKKVDEGVGVFEQIWDKVYSATTTAQKEKYEGDLKKEIKKLQRLRDHIKTWQGASNIKDKSKLDASRKLIEEKMEKFKICEKETKTKAFSKEGLAQDRTDPKQKAKEEVGEWVRECINRLQEQIEEFEAEIESLGSNKRKKKENASRIEEISQSMERHAHHVEMLERVLRAVDNDAVTPDEAGEVKESVEYYIESNQEPDFFEDEGMYDELNLDSVPAPVPVIGKLKTKIEDKAEKETEKSTKEGTEKEDGTLGLPGSSPTLSPSVAASRNRSLSPKTSKSPSPPARLKTHLHAAPKPSSPKSVRPERLSLGSPKPGNRILARNVTPSPAPSHGGSVPLMSSIVKGASSSGVVRPSMSAVVAGRGIAKASSTGPPPGITGKLNGKSDNYAAHLRRGIPMPSKMPAKSSPPMSAAAPSKEVDPPLPVTVSPPKYKEPSIEELEAQLGMLDSGAANMPESAEQERRFGLTQKNIVATPSCFPTVPLDNRAIFEKFDPDTLFFIFYYQQGTQQQYLAARELKQASWRFHKKYLTWFQRHEEPKVSTDEYEQGTYVYFDYVLKDEYENGWCQRIKAEFTFEYKYLEDELSVT